MARLETVAEVLGPWSPATSKRFWEGFAPAALPARDTDELRTVFRVEGDWSRAEARVTQDGGGARVVVSGDGVAYVFEAELSAISDLDDSDVLSNLEPILVGSIPPEQP